MTAEVSIMNRMGVALAADSAVTLGSPANKIYTSADKLFHLSRSAPVGVMIYGNSSFVGIPWETIIKSYRKQLDDRRFNKLEEYADDFLDFLRGERKIFTRNRQRNQVGLLIHLFLLHIRENVRETLTLEAEKRDGLEENDIPEIVHKIVKKICHEIGERDTISTLPRSTRNSIRQKYGPEIRRRKKDVFQNLPMNEGTRRLLTTTVIDMLVRDYFGPLQTGIVIAGFGEDDYMPALVSFEMEEMVLDEPRIMKRQANRIGDGLDSIVIPFAQRDMVCVFMEGVDRSLEEFMQQSITRLFFGFSNSLFDLLRRVDQQFGEALQEQVKPEIHRLLRELFEEWQTEKAHYWKPVVEVVTSLPKDELAGMAEALVNLTKFKYRVTTEQETVGGPIDVAVITKGDGYVWIKRKHYFDPQFNPRVMARY